MSEPSFEFKCKALQTIYKKLRSDEMFADFAYQYGFELTLADTIASGLMIELSGGGIKLVEETYAAMMAYVKESSQSQAMLVKLIN